MPLKARLSDDMKTALRAKDRERLGVLRLLHAAIRQREIDEQIDLDDPQVLATLDKMVKQRRDSQAQYESAGRADLAAAEATEITVLEDYLPAPLGEAELAALVDAAVAEAGATSMRDMGAVMGRLKPQVQGRADMGAVSAAVKRRLGG